jgi:hypothetical protein
MLAERGLGQRRYHQMRMTGETVFSKT